MTRPLRACVASSAVLALATIASPALAADGADGADVDAVLTVSTTVVGVDDVDADGATGEGDVITYRFVVENTGTEDLTGVGLVDGRVDSGGRVACGADTLAGGESGDCTLTYALTLADEVRGYVDSRVQAVAAAADGTEVVSAESTARQETRGPVARIQLRTSAGGIDDLDRDGPGVDDTIGYTFEITNTGNVALQQVAVGGPAGMQATCAAAPLPPGDVATCTGTHAITLAEAAAGVVGTAVTASGTSAQGLTAYASSTTTTAVVRAPELSIETTAVPSARGVIDYTVSVTNTGNVPFDPVRVTLGLVRDLACDRDALDPDEVMTCTASYAVTEEDRTRGDVRGTARAVGTGPGGGAVRASGTSTASLGPASGASGPAEPGDPVEPTGQPTAAPDGGPGTAGPSTAPGGGTTTGGGAGTTPVEPGTTADPTVIPDTSGPSWWLVAGAACAMAAGGALVLGRRRTRRG